MLGGTEVLIIALAVIPIGLLLVGAMVVGLVLLVRRSSATDRRLQALEQAVSKIKDR